MWHRVGGRQQMAVGREAFISQQMGIREKRGLGATLTSNAAPL